MIFKETYAAVLKGYLFRIPCIKLYWISVCDNAYLHMCLHIALKVFSFTLREETSFDDLKKSTFFYSINCKYNYSRIGCLGFKTKLKLVPII